MLNIKGLLGSFSGKANRYDEALEEAKKGSKELLDNIGDYNLTEEQESIVIDTLFEKSPIAYRSFKDTSDAKPSLCEKIVKKGIEKEHFYVAEKLHTYNLSQEERFKFAKQLAVMFPDEVAEFVPKYGLSSSQEKEIAVLLAKDPMGNISKDINYFKNLSIVDRKEIALIALETHPTKVYQNLDNYGFSDSTFISKHFTAYYTLEKLLPRLEKGESGAVLGEALKCVQQITEKSSLPEVFSRKLERIVKSTLKGASQREVIDLVHTINAYPSAMTLPLINMIQQKVEHLFPKLSEYCYSESGLTKLKGKGFDFLATSMGVPKDVHLYETIFVDDLPSKITDFLTNPTLKRAAIPVSFEKDLTNHFCPVYLEKDTEGNLRVFISDSTGELGEGKFPSQVIPHFEKFPVKDLYVMHSQRQFGTAVCSMFTLNDILEIARHGDIFSALEKDGEIKEAELGRVSYKQVMHPPVGLMKMTQSMTKVKKYIVEKGNQLIKANHSSVIGHGDEKLKNFVDMSSYYSMDHYGRTRNQNKFADWGMAKAFEIFLRQTAVG